MKPITLEEIKVNVQAEIVTLENVDIQAVQTYYLDTVCSQVNSGLLQIAKPRSPEYVLVQNKKHFEKEMQKNLKTNRLAIAKNW